MRIAHRELLRLLLQTDLHRLVTAAAEGTALRHVQKIDRRSADRDQTLLAVVHIRYGTEQPLRIFMTLHGRKYRLQSRAHRCFRRT